MILRLGGAIAVHTAAGVAMGVTTVLAACTVAQVAKKVVENAPGAGRGGMPRPPSGFPPSPTSSPPNPAPAADYSTPPPSEASRSS